MQVQRVQNNNNYKTSFGAKVNVMGCTDNITLQMSESWKHRAESIGHVNDTVCLIIGKAKEEYGHVNRSIRSFIVLDDGTIKENSYYSYRADIEICSHKDMITEYVNKFFDKLEGKIRK